VDMKALVFFFTFFGLLFSRLPVDRMEIVSFGGSKKEV
jgi:hypothetical protein